MSSQTFAYLEYLEYLVRIGELERIEADDGRHYLIEDKGEYPLCPAPFRFSAVTMFNCLIHSDESELLMLASSNASKPTTDAITLLRAETRQGCGL